MGLEIEREEFTAEEHEAFATRLAESLRVLADLLERPGFGEGPASVGAELEVSLVDEGGRPLCMNRDVLAESMDPRLTVELDRFNLESNLRHSPLQGRPFAALGREMHGALDEVSRAAACRGAGVAMVGILPTLRQSDLESDVMTDSARYRALSRSLRRLRREPFHLRIQGEDPLDLRCYDVTFEGAATSLQLHLRVAPQRFAAVYNAIQLATPVALAVAGNSPIFLGRRLWDETRVALFKQAVDHRPEELRRGTPARVSFGEGWITGPLELFRESVTRHPVLLPVMNGEAPREVLAGGGTPHLRELRLHQGTVWRWNRAIYDPAEGGHLRVEMRVLPAGPTIADMVANTAFYLGLALWLAEAEPAWSASWPFERLHRDFYRSAREGLAARLAWPTEPGAPLCETASQALVERLLPQAQAGLDRAGVERSDSEPWLVLVERRTRSGRTGAAWQRRALAAAEQRVGREEALARMFAHYRRHSESGVSVDAWPEAGA